MNSLLTFSANTAAYLSYFKDHLNFQMGLEDIRLSQNQKLKDILELSSKTEFGKERQLNSDTTYSDYVKKIPITDYNYWKPYIEKQRKSGENIITYKATKYQPTSGSTSKRKWIPYNDAILEEFNQAIAPWMYNSISNNKKILQGKQYWSLSWLPTELREELDNLDDLGYFSFIKRILMSLVMAVPNSISEAKTLEAAKFATVTFLISSKSISLISVWSPTFLLNLIDFLIEKKERFIDVLESGSWKEYTKELEGINCPQNLDVAKVLKAHKGEFNYRLAKKLWPKLVQISSWDTSTSKTYAKKLQSIFKGIRFEGKGLFATEGVVTIPYNGEFVLSYTSHFYEFLDESDQKIYLPHELKLGQKVKPVISMSNGFLRYKFDDVLEVVNFQKSCPCLKFLGRDSTIDLVGEKLNYQLVDEVIEKVNSELNSNNRVFCLLAIVGEKPHYKLLVDGQWSEEEQKEVLLKTEEFLNESFHYKLARELNQLGELETLHSNESCEQVYLDLCKEKGMVEGDVKLQSILKIDESDLLKMQQK